MENGVAALFFVWQMSRLMASVDGMQSEPAYPAGRYFVKLKGGSYLEGDELVSRWLCTTAAAAATATATLSVGWTATLSVGWAARRIQVRAGGCTLIRRSCLGSWGRRLRAVRWDHHVGECRMAAW